MEEKPNASDGKRRRTLGFTELEYVCPFCTTRNPGSHKFCTSCGAAQPPDVAFVQPAQETLITDEKRIAALQAQRPDVNCPYCQARNAAEAKFCKQCGGDLQEAAAREAGQVLGAHKDAPAGEIACPNCGVSNPGTARKCSACFAPLPRPDDAALRPPVPVATRSGGSGRTALIAVGVGALALILLCYFLFLRTTAVVGAVQSVEWVRSVAILGLAPVQREAWQDQIPRDAEEVGRCTERVRYTQPNPIAGLRSVEVCGTPYTIDRGTGFGEVVQDCEYQIYDNWCRYTALDWQVVNVVKATGTDFQPYWPTTALTGSDQRLGQQEEQYTVIFRADGRDYTYTTNDAEQFARLQENETWVLNINSLGGVQSVEPGR